MSLHEPTERVAGTLLAAILIAALLMAGGIRPAPFDFDAIEQAEHVARWRDN